MLLGDYLKIIYLEILKTWLVKERAGALNGQRIGGAIRREKYYENYWHDLSHVPHNWHWRRVGAVVTALPLTLS